MTSTDLSELNMCLIKLSNPFWPIFLEAQSLDVDIQQN